MNSSEDADGSDLEVLDTSTKTGTYTTSIESVALDPKDNTNTKVVITFKNTPFAGLKDEAIIGVAIKKSVAGEGAETGITYQLTSVDGEILETNAATAVAFQKKDSMIAVYKEANAGTSVDLTDNSTYDPAE